MKLYAAFETNDGKQSVALWINSRVNFIVVEKNGVQQAWNDDNNPTSVNFEVQDNDSIDIMLYRNGTDKVTGKMTFRYCGVKTERDQEGYHFLQHSIYLFSDLTKNLEIVPSRSIKFLSELPEWKTVVFAPENATYKIALHNEQERQTLIEGANDLNSALNAAFHLMGDNSPYTTGAIISEGKTVYQLGQENQDAEITPTILLSVRDHNRLHVQFSCSGKIQTSIFDGEKILQEESNCYTLENLKQGQKFSVDVVSRVNGELRNANVTYHYIDGVRMVGSFSEITLYIEKINGIIKIEYSPRVKFISMKKLVYMPLRDASLEAHTFHLKEEIVFSSANDAFSYAIAGDTIYQCFVPGTITDDGFSYASRIFIDRAI